MLWSRKSCRMHDALYCSPNVEDNMNYFYLFFWCPSRYTLGNFGLVVCDTGIFPAMWQYGCFIKPDIFLCIRYRNLDAIGLWHMRDIFTIFLWRSYIPWPTSCSRTPRIESKPFQLWLSQRVWDYTPWECTSFILLMGQ